MHLLPRKGNTDPPIKKHEFPRAGTVEDDLSAMQSLHRVAVDLPPIETRCYLPEKCSHQPPRHAQTRMQNIVFWRGVWKHELVLCSSRKQRQ